MAQKPRSGCTLLLVAFVLGLIFWLVLLFMALVGISITFRGVSISIGMKTILLGLIGWISTLIGWRKADRGESALKVGVLGGVLMLFTLSPIPGILAIVGGVRSRKPK